MRKKRKTKTVEDRFWSKVRITDTCLLWTGSKNKKGYGSFGGPDGKTMVAHHFLLRKRPRPGQCARHICHTPSCVNPLHIVIGTYKENTADMVNAGRLVVPGFRGEQHGNTKLTEDQARLAKACPRRPGALIKLAKIFGVSKDAIIVIRLGTNWKHLPAPSLEDRHRVDVLLESH